MIIAAFNNMLVLLSVVIAVIYAFRFRQHTKSYKVFTIYLAFIASIQVLLFIYAQNKLNNLFLFPYYYIGQFVFMSGFYYFLLRKKWILYLIPVFLGTLVLQYALFPETVKEFNPFGLSITQSIIIIYALLHYYRSLLGTPEFLLVNAGVLLYFTTSILFFASAEWIRELDLPFLVNDIYRSTNDVLYFFFLVLMFVEWYQNYRHKK